MFIFMTPEFKSVLIIPWKIELITSTNLGFSFTKSNPEIYTLVSKLLTEISVAFEPVSNVRIVIIMLDCFIGRFRVYKLFLLI